MGGGDAAEGLEGIDGHGEDGIGFGDEAPGQGWGGVGFGCMAQQTQGGEAGVGVIGIEADEGTG